MARMTITLPDQLHQALKQAAARRQQPMAEIIAESLTFYGIKSTESAAEIVARARSASRMSENEASRLALREVQATRQE
ncbi:MAG: CopG family transcriptional regulator [Thermoanaerobaculia bacterium]|nr:CopG family transcriptional regulator [Thermoanaerobaculia bacterium]